MARTFDGNDLLESPDGTDREPTNTNTTFCCIKYSSATNKVIWEKGASNNSGFSWQSGRTNGGEPLCNFGAGGVGNRTSFTSDLSDDVWKMCAISINGADATGLAYFDGTADTFDDDTATPSYSTEVLDIGSRGGGTGFIGEIFYLAIIKGEAFQAAKMAALTRGANIFGFGANLTYLVPLWGDQDPEPDYTGNGGVASVITAGGKSTQGNAPVELLENYL